MIRARLLRDSSMTVTRLGNTMDNLSDTGDVSNPVTTILTDEPCRVTRNKKDDASPVKVQGMEINSDHKIFCNPTVAEIKEGDIITVTGVGSGEYIADYNDDVPGGTNNHQEIYSTKRNA